MAQQMTYTTAGTAETEAVGRALCERLLAAGRRTAFVRGFVSALLPDARVKSPTYTIVNEYRGASIPVFHFDVYRIEGEDDLYSTGYYDYLDAGYLLCEWSEKIPFALPGDRITVRIEKTDGADGRRITLTLPEGASD